MMLANDQIIIVRLDEAQLRFVRQNAELASIGGRSNIRSRSERQDTLGGDQLIGQLGLYATNIWLSGSEIGYLASRWFQNRVPKKGDAGGDIPGANIDTKCSMMRRSKDPMEYHLPVRPGERHPGQIYILALVDALTEKSATVFLVGWITDAGLPADVASGGPLAGAHVVKAEDLHPLPPIEWWR